MPLGKTTRFSVFARDLFTCQYCGQQPPAVVLEVDHIHPKSKGGTDDDLNLVTACFDCNRGKRDRIISDVAPRPDANLKLLKMEQEAGEIALYLSSKKTMESLLISACDSLRSSWEKYLGDHLPPDSTLVPWINRYGVQEVEEAILIASRKYGYDACAASSSYIFRKAVPWIGAILRNRADKEGR